MSYKLSALGKESEGKVNLPSLLTMGVGVEAPGRDHHSMSSQNRQGHNMTNGFNTDNHGQSNGGKLIIWSLLKYKPYFTPKFYRVK